MKALLGWESPALGLAKWYRADMATQGSEELNLVQSVWNQNQHLNFYAAWCWAGEHCLMEPGDIKPEVVSKTEPYGDESWWASLARQPAPRFTPLYGGYNPLHLGHSDEFGCDAADLAKSHLVSEVSTRRAVLVVSSLERWRSELIAHGAALKPQVDRSWHVEVFDRQFGYLGKFRQSRETGRWFIGSHSVHMMGY